jgi:hypothetical protein
VDLAFDCVGATPTPFAATPGFELRLRIAEVSGARIDAIALRCQIRIEPHRRRYDAAEAAALRDLFGDTQRWADTLKPIQFAQIAAMVPGFTGAVTVDLPVPCGYDLEVAAGKYFDALADGVVPLLLLFSGTVFAVEDGRLRVEQVPWRHEAAYGLPVSVWRATVDAHFPDRAWLTVRRDTMAALREFKSRNALPTWDATVAALLTRAENHFPPTERSA